MKIAVIFAFFAMLFIGMIVSQPLTGLNQHQAGLHDPKNEKHRAACGRRTTTTTTTARPANATG
ncbi:hypothetical protein CBL_06996 [Carabus blaptoides fortunei]